LSNVIEGSVLLRGMKMCSVFSCKGLKGRRRKSARWNVRIFQFQTLRHCRRILEMLRMTFGKQWRLT